jgi:hypothetical protein
MKKQSSLSIILMLALVAQIFGQNPAPQTSDDDDVVRITTNLIQVDAVVTDKDGKPVTDLRAEDFEILENGKEQEITNFSYVPLAPASRKSSAASATPADKNAPPVPPTRLQPEQVRRTIALVIDDLGLSFESIYYVRRALKKFVDEQMQEGDFVAIVRTGGGMGALQSFTSDKRQLYAAIERVKWNQLGRGGVSAVAPIDGNNIQTETKAGLPGRTSGADINDELNQFSDEIYSVGTLGALNHIVRGLREMPGRKSVMLVSDGIKIFNREGQSDRILDALRRLTDLANRASVVIYTMDARGLQSLTLMAEDNVSGMTMQQVESRLFDRRADYIESQNGLIYLAKQTGGLAVRGTNDLSAGIKEMLDDQQGYYLIGYRPDEGTFDPKRIQFTNLKIKVKRPGLKVRYRNGFLNITDEQARPEIQRTREAQLIHAIISPFSASDIGVRLTSLFANDPKSGTFMRSLLHVDAKGLTFTEEADGWHKVVFDIMAVTFGDNGKLVDEASRTHTVRVRGETYKRIMRDGFEYVITVPIKKAGAYQLRTALRDSATQRVGSASQFIEVPDINKNRLMISGLVLNGFDPAKQTKNAVAGQPDAVLESEPDAGPAVRRLRRSMVLDIGYVIYNARLDKATQRPQLQTQLKLFRDGQEIFAGNLVNYDASQQTDLKRLNAGGRLQLGTEMTPGDYVVQVIVTDLLAKDKHRTSTQWIDFQIVEK